MSDVIVINSKFMRETSNFKVIASVTETEFESEDPILLKYIEKNLKPEELLGTIVFVPDLVFSIGSVSLYDEDDTVYYSLRSYATATPDSNPLALYYVPSTGALSLNAPYVEEEEGSNGDDDVVVVNPSPLDPTS